MTQGAACEPNGKPASFQGFESVFSSLFGGPLSGWTGGEGEMKRIREGEFIPLTLQSELFLAAVWGKNMMEVYHRHSAEVKRVASLMSVLIICVYVCESVKRSDEWDLKNVFQAYLRVFKKMNKLSRTENT